MSCERLLSVALEETSTAGASPTTSIDSVSPPRARVKFTSATRATDTTMLSCRLARKLESSAVMEYVPGSKATNR